jgi:hypothetical protein
VSATSFIETYVHLSSASFQIVLASPSGSAPVFKVRLNLDARFCVSGLEPMSNWYNLQFEDEKSQQWVKSKANMWNSIKSISEVRESDFCSIVIPSCLGGLQDLAPSDSSCAKFMSAFLLLNSMLTKLLK